MDSSLNLHDLRDGLGHAHITTTSRFVRSTPVRLAQALERMEAVAETVVDADDQPDLAGCGDWHAVSGTGLLATRCFS